MTTGWVILIGLFAVSILSADVMAASVRGWTRKDGTSIAPHQRTNPDGNPFNHYGVPGNYHPNTGTITNGDQQRSLDQHKSGQGGLGSSGGYQNPFARSLLPHIPSGGMATLRRKAAYMTRLILVIAVVGTVFWVSDGSTCMEVTSAPATDCTAILHGEARRGCCSWHQGVCGCAASRLQCCDGTLSPSCPCHQEDRTRLPQVS